MRTDDPGTSAAPPDLARSRPVGPRLRFPSTLRLKGDERIRRIYHSPHQFKHRYIRCYFALQTDRPRPPHPPIQFAFAVPKRRFRRAHQRHYIRRRLREALRLSQHTWRPWFADAPATLGVYLLYLGHAEPETAKLQPFLLQILRRMADALPQLQADCAASTADAANTPAESPEHPHADASAAASPMPSTLPQLPD